MRTYRSDEDRTSLCGRDGMVDIPDLKSVGRMPVWVRIPPPAPHTYPKFRKSLKIRDFPLYMETLLIIILAFYPYFGQCITNQSGVNHEYKGRIHMAAFKQLASGKWQAQIFKAGKRTSKSFPTKKAAKDWAAREEYLAVNAEPVESTMLVKGCV